MSNLQNTDKNLYGIMVAEYWSELPPKEKLEQKLHSILMEAKERMEIKRIEKRE